MIYVDSSVALAHLLSEPRRPATSLWDEDLVSSRLLEYELWVRVHAYGAERAAADGVRTMLAVVDMMELSPLVLDRALRPFPIPVRTLDALHLASVEYLRQKGRPVALATYDDRMAAAARALGIPLADF